MKVCIYLRKSREDIEAEKQGKGETLAKHRTALLRIAKDKNLDIVQIYEEIVTGESIEIRPMMKQLIEDVSKGLYDAVLVMDIQRLGRGGLQDQGLILDTFKQSNTKIITEKKTYDLSNEFDEEYSEFEAFMSRKEYKMITRRMQSGRRRSVESGNYLGSNAPFGYKFEYKGKERLLVPNENADTVRMIFDMYVNGNGCGKIKNALNKAGLKTATGKQWSSETVISALKNPIYYGIVRWRTKEKETYAKGKHEPIISEETYNTTKAILETRYHVPYKDKISNPLAGLVKCRKCGYMMVSRPYIHKTEPWMMCYHNCGNKSVKLSHVEKRIVTYLEELLSEYEINAKLTYKPNDTLKTLQKQHADLLKEIEATELQKMNLHTLLERGAYDIDTFKSRMMFVSTELEKTNQKLLNVSDLIKKEKDRIKSEKQIIPKIKKALDLYRDADNAEIRNGILKSLIEKVEYEKAKSQYDNDFDLYIYPKIDKL